MDFIWTEMRLTVLWMSIIKSLPTLHASLIKHLSAPTKFVFITVLYVMVRTIVETGVMKLITAVSVINSRWSMDPLYRISLASAICEEGTFFCPGHKTLCASNSIICDGKVDCGDSRDEPITCRSEFCTLISWLSSCPLLVMYNRPSSLALPDQSFLLILLQSLLLSWKL